MNTKDPTRNEWDLHYYSNHHTAGVPARVVGSTPPTTVVAAVVVSEDESMGEPASATFTLT